VFHYETGRIVPGYLSALSVIPHALTRSGSGSPVVEDLTAEHVAPDPPTVFVPLLPEPVVAENLGVEVVRLVRGMVHMEFRALEEEEAVVVYLLLATVETEEYSDVYAICVVNNLQSIS
jgi:hypothetical protein